jgi:hypothetical protein
MADRFFFSLAVWAHLDRDHQPPETRWLTPWVTEQQGIRRRFLIARLPQ